MAHLVPSWLTRPIVSFVDGSTHDANVLGALPVAMLVYALVLATAHWTRGGEAGFLDIACVPQGNGAEITRGITMLGAVLARSERMVMLVDEHFWQRLWVCQPLCGGSKRSRGQTQRTTERGLSHQSCRERDDSDGV